MGRENKVLPENLRDLADRAKVIFLETEERDPAMARALAMRHIVELCPVTLEPDTVLLGGEDPFLFNLMLPCLQADRHSRRARPPDPLPRGMWWGPCFEGHITPVVERLAVEGLGTLRKRLKDRLASVRDQKRPEATWYRAALTAADNVGIYAARLAQEAHRTAGSCGESDWGAELLRGADILDRVPERPAQTMREAMQSYWLVYILVTMEMGGCAPGGGIGLGRLDQFLMPYYRRDVEAGRLTRAGAVELLELFLLCFRHCDYYTDHQIYTPGSQSSLGGVTPAGEDASNEMSELLMEASLRIAMPAPYLSLRLHRNMNPRFARAAANYVIGGLGFPVVNDEAYVPAFERYGRTQADARDYICACCYEPTIPGREAYHPSCVFLNLPMILECILNNGRTIKEGAVLADTIEELESFGQLLSILEKEIAGVIDRIVTLVNIADREHCKWRRYPLMSLFVDDCVEKGQDVCAGGARYNPTGVVISGMVNCVDALSAVRHCVFDERSSDMTTLRKALIANFDGFDEVRRALRSAPKWGDDRRHVDELGRLVADMLLRAFVGQRNARGGPYQPALYSFITNRSFGEYAGASADGRLAGTPLWRNLSPAPGSNRRGPTALLASASLVDTTGFPNGWALDLNFDPNLFVGEEGGERFEGFLRGFVATGVPQIQVTMADLKTLLDAREHPEDHQELMVKVAGFSARFVDLPVDEQEQVLRKAGYTG